MWLKNLADDKTRLKKMALASPHAEILSMRCNPPRSLLGPAEVLQRKPGVPYLSHVDDLVTPELHNIDVVGARATARRRHGAAGLWVA